MKKICFLIAIIFSYSIHSMDLNESVNGHVSGLEPDQELSNAPSAGPGPASVSVETKESDALIKLLLERTEPKENSAAAEGWLNNLKNLIPSKNSMLVGLLKSGKYKLIKDLILAGSDLNILDFSKINNHLSNKLNSFLHGQLKKLMTKNKYYRRIANIILEPLPLIELLDILDKNLSAVDKNAISSALRVIIEGCDAEVLEKLHSALQSDAIDYYNLSCKIVEDAKNIKKINFEKIEALYNSPAEFQKFILEKLPQIGIDINFDFSRFSDPNLNSDPVLQQQLINDVQTALLPIIPQLTLPRLLQLIPFLVEITEIDAESLSKIQQYITLAPQLFTEKIVPNYELLKQSTPLIISNINAPEVQQLLLKAVENVNNAEMAAIFKKIFNNIGLIDLDRIKEVLFELIKSNQLNFMQSPSYQRAVSQQLNWGQLFSDRNMPPQLLKIMIEIFIFVSSENIDVAFELADSVGNKYAKQYLIAAREKLMQNLFDEVRSESNNILIKHLMDRLGDNVTDSNKNSALNLAIKCGNIDLVKYLLLYDLKNITPEMLTMPDANGNGPIDNAFALMAASGKSEIFDLLMQLAGYEKDTTQLVKSNAANAETENKDVKDQNINLVESNPAAHSPKRKSACQRCVIL